VLVVTAVRTDGTSATVRFEEGRIVVAGAKTLTAEYADGAFRKSISGTGRGVDFIFQNFRYSVPLVGEIKSTAKGFSVSGEKIEFDMTKQNF
jgi:hypothetical protein